MANLKELKIRIGSVKSTQKITKAMKMVAAAKLRRAQEQAEAGRPYAERMDDMLRGLASSLGDSENAPKLLAGTGKNTTHLLVVMTSHRGLCGAFNGALIRQVKKEVEVLRAKGKRVKVLCLGKKGQELLKSSHGDILIPLTPELKEVGKDKPRFADGQNIASKIIDMLDSNEFDSCTLVYNQFISAISQKVTFQKLIPLELPANDNKEKATSNVSAVYDYEPDETAVLADLLPRNLSVQFYRALLESAASEHGARMTAMDNATRNAGEMIKSLTLVYNRTRQAAITKELIEIISGAEAV